MTLRRDHLQENCLKIARMNHRAGMLDTPYKTWYLNQARVWYLDLLPGVEMERGRDDPLTTEMVAWLLELFHEQEDRSAAVKFMLEWSQGGALW